jgi:serine phosphatase RsbU (regulator of sigma subunit)
MGDLESKRARARAALPPAVHDPARLAAVARTGLLDTPSEEPFDHLTRLAATLLDAPLAFATIVDETRSFWKSSFGVGSGERQNPVEESFCQYVIGAHHELTIDDAAADPRTRDNPSVESMGVAAWAGFPLMAPDGQVLGSFCVIDTRPRRWTSRDVEVLRALSAAAAAEIALRAALEQARALAETLQESLLPPELPPIPGLDVAARFSPAGLGTELMGDFYDVVRSRDGRFSFVVGDVAGKGVEAAKVAALARYTVGAVAMRTPAPADVLAALNDTLRARDLGPALFLTAVYGVLDDPTDGGCEVSLGSAGHNPPLVRRAGGRVEWLHGRGRLVGVLPDLGTEPLTVGLAPGDALVVYTDGVVEARVGRGEPFGDARLADLVATSADRDDADRLAARVHDAALAYCQGVPSDDVAVLVVRVPG